MLNLSINTESFEYEIQSVLHLFDKAQEWADLSNCLSRLHKVLQKYNLSIAVLSNCEAIASKLTECLNPSLPAGVHLKCLDVYKEIFSKFDEEYFCNNLGFWSCGLFPVFADSSFQVKPVFIEIIKTFYIPINKKLLPCLSGLLVALLPGLETIADGSQTELKYILKCIEECVGTKQFCCTLWIVALRTSRVRLPALNLLHSIISVPKIDICDVLPFQDTLVLNAIATIFHDESILVQRHLLDLLIQFVPFNSNIFNKDQQVFLLYHALYVFSKNETSLVRRVINWITDETEIYSKKNLLAYFEQHVESVFEEALIMHFQNSLKNKNQQTSELIRPLKIIQIVCKEIENLTSSLFDKILSHFIDYMNSLTEDSRAHVVQVLISLINSQIIDCNKLFETLDTVLEKYACEEKGINLLTLSQFFIENVISENEKSIYHHKLIKQCLNCLNISLTKTTSLLLWNKLFEFLRDCFIQMYEKYQSLQNIESQTIEQFFSILEFYYSCKIDEIAPSYVFPEKLFEILILILQYYKSNHIEIPLKWLTVIYERALTEVKSQEHFTLITSNLFTNILFSVESNLPAIYINLDRFNDLRSLLWKKLTDTTWGFDCAIILLRLNSVEVTFNEMSSNNDISLLQELLINNLASRNEDNQCLAFQRFNIMWQVAHKHSSNNNILFDGMIIVLDCLDSNIPALQSMCSLWLSTSLSENLSDILDPLLYKLLNLDLEPHPTCPWRYTENFDTGIVSYILSKLVAVIRADPVSFINSADVAWLPRDLMTLFDTKLKIDGDRILDGYLLPSSVLTYLDLICLMAARFLLTDSHIKSSVQTVQSSAANLLKVLVTQTLPHISTLRKFYIKRCLLPVYLKAFNTLNYNPTIMCQCLSTFMIIYSCAFEMLPKKQVYLCADLHKSLDYSLENDYPDVSKMPRNKSFSNTLIYPNTHSTIQQLIQKSNIKLSQEETISTENLLEKTGNFKLTPSENSRKNLVSPILESKINLFKVVKTYRVNQADLFTHPINCKTTIIPSISQLVLFFLHIKDTDISHDNLLISCLNSILMVLFKTVEIIPKTHVDYKITIEETLKCCMHVLVTSTEQIPSYFMLVGFIQILEFLITKNNPVAIQSMKEENNMKTSMWLKLFAPEKESELQTTIYCIVDEAFLPIVKTLVVFCKNHLPTNKKVTSYRFNKAATLRFFVFIDELDTYPAVFHILLLLFEKYPIKFLSSLTIMDIADFELVIDLMAKSECITLRQLLIYYTKLYTDLSTKNKKDNTESIAILSSVYIVVQAFENQLKQFIEADWKALANLILEVLSISSDYTILIWAFSLLFHVDNFAYSEEFHFSGETRQFGKELISLSRKLFSICVRTNDNVPKPNTSLVFIQSYLRESNKLSIQNSKDYFIKYLEHNGNIVYETNPSYQWGQLALCAFIQFINSLRTSEKISYIQKHLLFEIDIIYVSNLIPIFRKFISIENIQYRYLILSFGSALIKAECLNLNKENISIEFFNFLNNYTVSTDEIQKISKSIVPKFYYMFTLDRRSFRLFTKIMSVSLSSQSLLKNLLDKTFSSRSLWAVFKLQDKDEHYLIKARELKKLAYVLMSTPTRFLLPFCSFLINNLGTFLRAEKKRQLLEIYLCQQVILCYRIILLRCNGSPNISKLWPIVFSEFNSLCTNLTKNDTGLVFQILKFIDLAIMLNISDFHFNQWIFVKDTLIEDEVEKSYKPLCSRILHNCTEGDASDDEDITTWTENRKPLINERKINFENLNSIINRINRYAVKTTVNCSFQFDESAAIKSIEDDILDCPKYLLDWAAESIITTLN